MTGYRVSLQHPIDDCKGEVLDWLLAQLAVTGVVFGCYFALLAISLGVIYEACF
ncbi:hypothetical protein ACFLXE_05090 [Chloroflexota bacterium]